ncbi:hypothetical protein LTR66_009969 [Elasticomyces elasticus]|nr:hypothetical protein LTR66_009969 [Elasticomyces elasticus]KAK4984174.1 hypothetical protein LTR50_006758 [Elasticomyces elasticus]
MEACTISLLDILSANALMQIASSGAAASSPSFKSSRKDLSWTPLAIGTAFLFNPFTILTSLGRPTSVFTYFFILLATAKACQGRIVTSAFAIAAAAYLSLYPILLFPPLAILCYDHVTIRYASNDTDRPAPTALRFFASQITIFLASSAVLLGLSAILTGDISFVASTYGTHLLLPDLTPNVGLWWYFFIEMFDSFRAFFLGVFWLHMASYMPGLCIRLRKQPLAVVVLMVGIISIFGPYTSIGDVGLFLSMLPLYAHVFPLMRYTFPALSTLLYAALLGPAFYHLWIYAGSGNANFFYAITLVWNLGLILVLADTLYAILRDEWEIERPEMKGKEVRQI